MQNDKITLRDLSVFSYEGESIFNLIDRTTSLAGKEMLRAYILQPPANYETLQQTQDTIKFWSQHPDLWPKNISNGTLVMLEKFFESADNTILPSGISLMVASFFQKMLNRNQEFFTQFSLSHLSDFLKGCRELADMLKLADLPHLLQKELQAIDEELKHRLTADVINVAKDTPYPSLMRISHSARREMKNMAYRLMQHYARLDAWHAMAVAGIEHKWVFPDLQPTGSIHFEAAGLFHPLLGKAVPYNIEFNNSRNFLLLTGANMSGKTTFMRALGVGALLAHLGMAVPATSFRISFMEGIITNMQVEDNILKGESYFFAEVQRMKQTASKLLQSGTHLVLMDELFKGTNVHDAYECTRAVVDGLLNHPNHIMILSTHLYEVAQHFSEHTEIQFAYFVTQMNEDNSYHFTYHLKNGISNDRIGYRILQKEGIIDMLKGNRNNSNK